MRARPKPTSVGAAPRRKAQLAMLPLYALAIGGGAALTARLGLGAWPLVVVLACPLLHLVRHD